MRFRAGPAVLFAIVLSSAVALGTPLWARRLPAQDPPQTPSPQQPAQPSNPPAPVPPLAESSQSIQQNVNRVEVLFTVSDKHDKAITNLNKEDFYVLDDGLRQEVREFSRQTDLPLRVGLLLDTSNSIRERLQFEKDAATDFLFNVIRRNRDMAFLMTVDDDPEVIQPFTNDAQQLRDVIARQRAGGGTALYDAIYTACEQLLNAPSAGTGQNEDVRRVLVVISDGEDNLSRHSRSEALEMVQRAGIVVYTISTSTDWILTDAETPSSRSGNRKIFKGPGDEVLQQFSDDSGGRAFFPYRVDDLAQSFADISDELRSQYSLTFTPRFTDGKFHTIQVGVQSQQYKVHARKSYLAPAESAASPLPRPPAVQR